MHHGKLLALVFAAATVTLSAAPTHAMSITPVTEGAFVLEVHQSPPAAITATDPALPKFREDHWDGDQGDDRDGRGHRRDDGDGDGHGDGHHHPGGGPDGGGTPQTVPLPAALPLLLSGLASLLTVARRRTQ